MHKNKATVNIFFLLMMNTALSLSLSFLFIFQCLVLSILGCYVYNFPKTSIYSNKQRPEQKKNNV